MSDSIALAVALRNRVEARLAFHADVNEKRDRPSVHVSDLIADVRDVLAAHKLDPCSGREEGHPCSRWPDSPAAEGERGGEVPCVHCADERCSQTSPHDGHLWSWKYIGSRQDNWCRCPGMQP